MRTLSISATQPQADFHALAQTCKHPLFLGGFGCVRPDTKIWTDEGLIRICDVKPLTRVLSWNEKSQKLQLSVSGGSYPKGKANLYQIATKQGVFDATEHHHVFSSERSYLPVKSLNVGSLLKTVSPRLLSTISEFGRLSSVLDVQHYSKIDEDYLVRYVTAARLYGLPLLSEKDTCQAYLPLLDDARKLCRSVDLSDTELMGGLVEQQLKHIHLGQSSYLHSTSHLDCRLPSLAPFEEGQTLALRAEHTLESRCTESLSLLKSEFHHSKLKHFFDGRSLDKPLINSEVLSIEDMGEEVYWDMQVLSTNNYITECGVIHHNTGKSEAMANQAFMDASVSSSALIGLYEPTYDLVRLIMAPRMEEKLSDFGIRYKYNKSENIIYTSSGQIGDFILRTLDNPSRIVGYETYCGHVDEIDTLKENQAREAWTKIIARNRQKPEGVENPFNKVCAYTTPEGFKFAYKTWRKEKTPGYEMIQASTLSNPYLPDDYVDTLRNTYPPQLIEAYINGEFVNLTSGAVYPEFDRVLNHSDETIQDNEPLYIGMDFNVNNMTAIIHVKRDGLPVAVDELFGIRDTPTMIQVIEDRYAGHKIYVYPDSSGKNNKSNQAGLTDISQLRSAGFTLKYRSVNPRIKDRVNCVNAMICNSKGERRYKVNTKRCPNTTDNLEQQVFDKNGEPDKKSDNDHGPDGLGYFVCYDYPIKGPRQSIKVSM